MSRIANVLLQTLIALALQLIPSLRHDGLALKETMKLP